MSRDRRPRARREDDRLLSLSSGDRVETPCSARSARAQSAASWWSRRLGMMARASSSAAIPARAFGQSARWTAGLEYGDWACLRSGVAGVSAFSPRSMARRSRAPDATSTATSRARWSGTPSPAPAVLARYVREMRATRCTRSEDVTRIIDAPGSAGFPGLEPCQYERGERYKHRRWSRPVPFPPRTTSSCRTDRTTMTTVPSTYAAIRRVLPLLLEAGNGMPTSAVRG